MAKTTRQSYVIGIYRWVIEVAFLFVAFTAFPDHKWPIGLAVLAFSAAIGGVVHMLAAAHQIQNGLMDEGERKTRHAIVLAAEMAGSGKVPINQSAFWLEVDERVDEERARQDELADEPTGFWKGLLLAAGSLVWQLVASLFGIALVAGLTTSY